MAPKPSVSSSTAHSLSLAESDSQPLYSNKESKKPKKAVEDDATSERSPRVWSEGDEILILKGMIDYQEKIGLHPSSDMEAFHAFIKKSLRAHASRNQLYDKVRRLKNKYWDNIQKLKKDANVASSWKTHHKKLFDLSNKIWLTESNDLQSPKGRKLGASVLPNTKLETSADTAEDVEEMEVERNWSPLIYSIRDYALDQKSGTVDMGSFVLERGLDLIKEPQRAELEQRWAKLRKEELRLFMERSKLILDQTKLVLEAHKEI